MDSPTAVTVDEVTLMLVTVRHKTACAVLRVNNSTPWTDFVNETGRTFSLDPSTLYLAFGTETKAYDATSILESPTRFMTVLETSESNSESSGDARIPIGNHSEKLVHLQGGWVSKAHVEGVWIVAGETLRTRPNLPFI